MEDERRHDGGAGTHSQVGMFTFLPQLVDSATFLHTLPLKNVVYSERDTAKEQFMPCCHIFRGK